MKSRFWNYLGMQVRQPFEAMLIQNGTDPYKLDMDGLVEALKAYSHVIGGEVYARPDAAESYAVLSISVKEDKKEKTSKTPEVIEDKSAKNLGQGRSVKKDIKTGEETNIKKYENRGPNNSSPTARDGFERRNFSNNRGRGGFQNRGTWRNSNYNSPTKQVATVAQQAPNEIPLMMPSPMMTPYYHLPQPMNLMATQPAYPSSTLATIGTTPIRPENSSPESNSRIRSEIAPPNNYQRRNGNSNNRGRGNGNGRNNFQRNDRPPPDKNLNTNYNRENSWKNNQNNRNWKSEGDNVRNTGNQNQDRKQAAGNTAIISSQGTGKEIYCYACAKPGHMVNECQLYRDSYDPTLDLKKVCTICRKRGHIHTVCPEKKGN